MHPGYALPPTLRRRAPGQRIRRPENSREAVAEAIQAGVPVIKIDVRASKDGSSTCSTTAGSTVPRTSGSGGASRASRPPSLPGARLANGETLPRFQELYEIARGRTILTVVLLLDGIHWL